MRLKRTLRHAGLASVATLAGVSGLVVALGQSSTPLPKVQTVAETTKTPIQHVVIIFQENESFDHYFGTYPVASNPAGEDLFTALPGTPSVNGLVANSLNGNVNLQSGNPNGANPTRLDPGANANGVYNASLDANGSNAAINQVLTCSQNHNYQPEEQAFDGGAMDQFPGRVGTGSGNVPEGAAEGTCAANTDLNYYDGNTVTGYWNYAQHYAMSDNSFGTTYGPSTPGAINAISGDTGNFNLSNNAATTPGLTATNSALVPDGQGAFSDINDADPYFDDCSSTSSNIGVTNYSGTGITDPNVGDLLSEQGISWGWFQGGFAPTTTPVGTTNAAYAGGPAAQGGKATCTAVHNTGAALGGDASNAQPYGSRTDYSAHHEPFQYYASTANPRHYAPTSLSAIGTDTQSWTGGSYGVGTPKFNTANHQYDISNFNDLMGAIRQGTLPATSLPAVSYLKAPLYEDEHPANSDPVDGQKFVTSEINSLMASPDWSSTAVIVAYDDSDGWYDHVYSGAQNGGKPQNASAAANVNGAVYTSADAEAPGVCGGTPITGTALGSSTVVTLGSNDTIAYSVGGVAQTPLVVPAATYTPTTLATAIEAASGNQIITQTTSTNKLTLTDNGMSVLAITGGDGLASFGLSASSSVAVVPTLTNDVGQPENGRCGFGPRLPFTVISPYAKTNFVDHTLSDQASIVNFIQYNWGLGTIPGSASQLLTNPATTFDLKNMFDFASGATDVAGGTPFILNTSTFQPASPKVSWSTPSAITYGTPLTSAQLNASATMNGSSVNGVFTYSPPLGTVLGAGTQTVKATFTPADTAAVNPVSTSISVQVNGAPLTVTATSPTFVRGQAVPAITATYSGFVNGDTGGNLQTPATCTTSATSSSNQGQYLSSCSGAVSSNYVFTYLNGEVSVVGAKATLPKKTDAVKGTNVLVPVRCSAFETQCVGTITLSIKEKVHKKTVSVVLAKSNYTLASAHTKTVSVKMTAAGKKLLLGRKTAIKVTETATTKTAKTTATVKVV